jgi:hypothetical protein
MMVLIATMFFSTFLTLANATGSPTPTPAPTPTTTSGADAAATAAARAKAEADALAQQQQKQKASADATLSSTDTSSSRALALSLFVQPPAFTPPMAQVQCASAHVKQEASSGWIILGGYSSANSTTDSSDCTLLNIRNAMVKECKYASAKQVEDLLVQKHLPKFAPNAQAYTKAAGDPGYVDYTPAQCAVLLTPPAPPPLVMLQDLIPPPAPEKPCPLGLIRNSKGVCYKSAPLCTPRQKLVRECRPVKS